MAPLFGADEQWSGSQACRPCHTTIYDAYSRTAMAASSGAVGSSRVRESLRDAAFDHAASGYRYRVNRTDQGHLELEWGKKDSARMHRAPMSVFIGSGTVARSYAIDRGGFLYQSPVAYYATTGKWDLAPGYARYNQPFLTRPILPGCLLCHASRIQHVPRTQNAYDMPAFSEGGVSCERCHGPGSAHIAAMRSVTKSAGPQIVNASRLAPERRDSVCAQCHLTGEVRIQKAGRGVDSFRAGDVLSDHVAVFVRSGGAGGMRVTSHVENLAQSVCKQRSGDRMWCGSCHDPHTEPEASKRVAWYRSKCLQCHQTQTCKAEPAARRAKNDDCTSCHMPRNPVTDAQHVVFTDHSIPRVPRTVTDSRGEIALIPFGATKVDERDTGIAYAVLGQRDSVNAYRERAFELLKAALKNGRRDAEALMYLADLHNQRSEREQAIKLYGEAIRLDPAQLTASVSLGAIRMENGEYEEAIRLWRDALSKNPALLLVRGNLAAALLKTGNRAEAEAVLRKATDYNPEFVTPLWLTDQLNTN
jgi:hypothetical protein